MVITSIGLVVLQVVQAYRSVSVSLNLFNVSVSNAMDQVVNQFNEMKVDDYVSVDDQTTIRTYRRYEELNDRMLEIVRANSDLFYNEREVTFGTVLQDSAFIRRGVRLSRSDSNVVSQYNMLLNARKRLQMSDGGTLDFLESGLIPGDQIFTSDFNYALLDSLVREELIVNGVDMAPVLGVMRGTEGDWVYLSHKNMRQTLLESPYRYNIHLGGLPSVDDYYVVVYFHSSDMRLIFRQRFDLYYSLILIAILVALFLVLIRVIRNQNTLDEMKTTFINNMTHEMKTPIATIGLTTEMLCDETVTLDEASRQRFLTVVKDENHRLQVLIDTILQNAKMSNKNYSISYEHVDLNECVQEAVNSFGLQVQSRGGQLDVQLDADPSVIDGDKLHLTNMVYNLVDNAVKYSEGAPHVTIATCNVEGGIQLSVRDAGIGIDPEDQKHIFDKFYRVSTGNVHNVKGFGIGLNYVSQVVSLHHATIKVESKIGEGSTFTLFFPNE